MICFNIDEAHSRHYKRTVMEIYLEIANYSVKNTGNFNINFAARVGHCKSSQG